LRQSPVMNTADEIKQAMADFQRAVPPLAAAT
jgi:hypothetical protein